MDFKQQLTYKINVFQGKDDWYAGIPELAILEKNNSPLGALESALDRQEIVLKQLKKEGVPFPPQEMRINPLSFASKMYAKFPPFILKVLITYILVLGFMAISLLLVYPKLHKYSEQYFLSSQMEKDIKKLMLKLNVNVCQKFP